MWGVTKGKGGGKGEEGTFQEVTWGGERQRKLRKKGGENGEQKLSGKKEENTKRKMGVGKA